MLRTPQNIKISKTIGRDELFNAHSTGMNFRGFMVNAMLDGIKTHTSRASNTQKQAPIVNTQYAEGKISYVRETILALPGTESFVYAADYDTPAELKAFRDQGYVNKCGFYVPRDMARVAIKIINPIHKPLHSLTFEERVSEGLLQKEINGYLHYFDYDLHFYKFNLRKMSEEAACFESFRTLWIKVNGVQSWYANPDVWSFFFEPMIIN